jgi:hypothetical protein
MGTDFTARNTCRSTRQRRAKAAAYASAPSRSMPPISTRQRPAQKASRASPFQPKWWAAASRRLRPRPRRKKACPRAAPTARNHGRDDSHHGVVMNARSWRAATTLACNSGPDINPPRVRCR